MKLEEYRTVFAAGSLVLILVAAAPTVSLFVSFPDGSESFSELWLLGPNHMAKDYPFNVEVNETYSVFVGVGNHLGGSSYYLVYVKFRNQTEPLPNATVSEPSPLSPLYEFRFFVVDGDTWEETLTFSVLEVSRNDDFMFVDRLSVNDVIFSVNASTRWDSENNGFYFQLFFELWLYNVTSQSFEFHNRFVGIWLNVTGS
jgi:uncharacterized membrane protein